MSNKYQFLKVQKIKPGYTVSLIWSLESGYYLCFDACFLVL